MAPGNLITSLGNPLAKRLRALSQRKRRETERAFVVEGIQPVWQAVERQAEVEALIVSPELLTRRAAVEMVETREALGTRVVRVSRAVFESFADRDNPSGLAAIVRMRERALEDLPLEPRSLLVALHEVGNPGNLGTILRTLDAVRGTALVLLGQTTDPYHPTAVKASMGTLFTVPSVRLRDANPLLDWCRRGGLTLVATSAHAKQDFWTVTYTRPLCLLFGSEGEGLPPELLGRGDVAVRIPMAGAATSLNLAVAVGVLLYEVERQTRDA